CCLLGVDASDTTHGPEHRLVHNHENRSAKRGANNVAGAKIEGGRTAVSFRPATKGGCLARPTPRLDRRSHPSGRSPDFLVCPRLTSFSCSHSGGTRWAGPTWSAGAVRSSFVVRPALAMMWMWTWVRMRGRWRGCAW